MSHPDCKFNHLDEDQKSLLIGDIAASFARLIQDDYHALLSEELALGLGQCAARSGIDAMNAVLDNALKYNQLAAAIVIQGFAGDVPK